VSHLPLPYIMDTPTRCRRLKPNDGYGSGL
jgi:hypothetical protein